MTTKQVRLSFCVAMPGSLLTIAHAQSPIVETLTMDEVPFQPVDGLTVKGVTFHDTNGADYDSADGGQQVYTQDPVIEGQTAGEALTMDFAFPVYSIQFGVTISSQGFHSDAFTVSIYDCNGNLIRTSSLDAAQIGNDNFSEGCYTRILATPICKATVTFNTADASAFGLDNLVLNSSLASSWFDWY